MQRLGNNSNMYHYHRSIFVLCQFHNELLITIKREILTRLFCLLSELLMLITHPLDFFNFWLLLSSVFQM